MYMNGIKGLGEYEYEYGEYPVFEPQPDTSGGSVWGEFPTVPQSWVNLASKGLEVWGKTQVAKDQKEMVTTLNRQPISYSPAPMPQRQVWSPFPAVMGASGAGGTLVLAGFAALAAFMYFRR